MIFTTLAAAAALGMQTEAAPADPLDAVRALAADNVYTLTVADGALSGPGGEFLMERAAEAQFVAIGEQHATADIAEFAQAWFAGLSGIGFDYMAVEVGPWSTVRAEALLREGTGAFEADAAARAGGLAYPFLFFAEETALARQVVASHDGAAPALWGLDQEFVASGSIHAEALAAHAQTDAQQAVVAEIEAALAEDPFLVGNAPQDRWTGWAEAWGDEGEGAEILADLVASNRIYAPFTGRGGGVWTANQTREDGMKRLFLENFAGAEIADGEPPRVFLKFGANHLTRGLSGTRVASLGNFLAEWGLPRDLALFNVMADCAGGEMVQLPAGATTACRQYFSIESNPFSELASDGPVVVDLIALRDHAATAQGLEDALVDLIFAYDAYVVFPDVRPAQLISAE